MTHPIRNREPRANRSRLMLGCGSAALALAIMLAPQRAEAQGVQAGSSVTSGAAAVTNTAANETTVDVSSSVAVIDWTPFEDAAGNALDFLPTNNRLIFQNAPEQGGFSVLNRILPSTNGNIAVINGSVISRLQTVSGPSTPGGFVAFYSPTGILVGSNATFDVGRLLLTTLDPDIQSFQGFASSGATLSLNGAQGSTARIQINPGAQITATQENSFFAVVAADVQMLGTARVNGSHAFVAGEVVNLSFSNGLFDISVPVGTAAGGTVVELGGTVGGPSSTGAGDNHLLYAVARASADPISMIFRGNLGFDPAQSAGVVNGEIILSANYNVFGRTVDGGTISDGIDATFNGNSELSTTRADIFLEDFAASSSLLAISTHRTQVTARTTASSVDGNLLIVGRENAELTASDGQTFTITGDVLVDARDYGVVSSSLQSLDAINAQGGTAFIDAFGGGTLRINGNALVTASAFGGADDLNRIAGTARGGSALIGSTGGNLIIDGGVEILADAFGTRIGNIRTGAEARGGLAAFFATQGGRVAVRQNVTVSAKAVAAEGNLSSSSSVSNAFGGRAQVTLFDGGTLLDVVGNVSLSADAIAGSGNASTGGAVADAGEATAVVNGVHELRVGGSLSLSANALGGGNGGGKGGTALGGRASAATFNGGRITVGNDFRADGSAIGGDGTDGGDAFGGVVGATAVAGAVTFGTIGATTTSATADASAIGGNAVGGATAGTGGIGRGGNAFFQAEGSAAIRSSLTINGGVEVYADGTGGFGRSSDGDSLTAGSGGAGFGGNLSTPNQADPRFGSGAFLLAGADYGTLRVTGNALVSSVGTGGRGGDAAGQLTGGLGGNGFGGLAQAGLALLGGPGTVGQGSATFADLIVIAQGFGGAGGNDLSGATPAGLGGNGTGGGALLQASAGEVLAANVRLAADGFGGDGARGGDGRGGDRSGAFTNFGGRISLASLEAFAQGWGGSGLGLGGGSGFGGQAFMGFQSGTTIVNGDVTVDASGFGGSDFQTGNGGNGTGGIADLAVFVPSIGSGTVTGNASVIANGFGGNAAGNGASGGDGVGGRSFVQSQAGGTVRLGSARIIANGTGGSGTVAAGGAGTGGVADILSTGSGSRVIVERNVASAQLLAGVSAMSSANAAANSEAMVAAVGTGGSTNGGNGFGGTGRGGTIEIAARAGGSIALPLDPQNDPGSVGAIRVTASGIGGGSSSEGGQGGQASGGIAQIIADGTSSRVTMGETIFNVFAQGGSSLSSTSNITGGAAVGGRRIIRALNGGEASLALVGGNSGSEGGDGSGTGNGGTAFGGSNVVDLNNGRLNITGVLTLNDDTTGGDGNRGGDAFGNGEGGAFQFSALGSIITLTPNASGQAGIVLGGTVAGGTGVMAGGDAIAAPVTFTLNDTDLRGFIRINPRAVGGSVTGPSGNGGNATGSQINVTIIDSTLNLLGENLITVTAEGGNGGLGAGGVGGAAVSGQIGQEGLSVTLTRSILAVAASPSGPGILRVQSIARGGGGMVTGAATSGRARIDLASTSRLTGGELYVESLAIADRGSGGAAVSEIARISTSSSELFAELVQITANAKTGLGGTSDGGLADLQASSSTILADTMRLAADGIGADPARLANRAGYFSIVFSQGVAALNLTATALGDVADPNPSLIAARGGDVNLVSTLTANVFGDLDIETTSSGTIGSAATAGTTTAIQLQAGGTIEVVGDGSTAGGLGGQTISLLAGRSILLNGNLSARDGAIVLTANRGGGQALGQPTASVISMAQGTRINAGTGTVTIRLLDGAGDPQRVNGAITLASIAASRIDVRNLGSSAGSNIGVLADGVLTASGSGRAIDLASLNGEVINLAGDAGLVLTGGGHYGIFAAAPTGSQIGSFANYARRYNVANATAYDTLNPGGNFAAFRIAPVLTVTANAATRFYGSANPLFTANFAGFQPGDGITNLSGTPQLTTAATVTSNVGVFAINAALGSLLSEQGYQFTFNPGLLTITARPITITASNLTRVYGNANPALTFAVGGQGLVNGDQLSGALATTAGVSTGVGIVPISQGTLAASSNYALTFVGGQLTITPRPLSLTADNLEKLLGQPDPLLTFTLSGDGLIDGDQVSGSLVRDPGEAIASFAIRQGTLSAGPNYAITFGDGELTINAPPVPAELTNQTVIDMPFLANQELPISSEEEEERFGIDFPEQPEASLISEDPLVDDPVSSGGDASLYGGTPTSPQGSK